MLPREHGAYGQLGFPLATALVVAGGSPAGLLIATAAIATFLAHEPAEILLGHRGPRALRDQGPRARLAFVTFTLAALGAGLGALAALEPSAYWSLAVPLIPAILLSACTVTHREKTWYGEVTAAIAFSTVAVPIAVAGGGTMRQALTIAIPFALFSVLSTLAVRVVILRVRGGGDPVASSRTSRAVFTLSGLAIVALAALAAASALPWTIPAAAVPGVLAATIVAAFPPPPAKLKRLGWTLMGASLLTAAIVIGAAAV
ncbi:MAG: YwiC-like family protein [Vicinamibacterales bacterium]